MVATVEAVTFSSAEVCARAGCTYRQIDYWAQIGLCESSAASCNGPGTQRRWTERDIAVVTVLTDLARLSPNARTHKLRELMTTFRQSPSGWWVVLAPSGSVTAVHLDMLAGLLEVERCAICVRVP